MRKLLTLALIAATVIGVNAQDMGASVVLLNSATVKKKVEKNNAAIENPKKNIKAATWQKRGDLFQDVFNIGLEQTQEGMDSKMLTLFYKEPNSIENETKEDGSVQATYLYNDMKYVFVDDVLQKWERVNPINEDPLRTAIDAYKKALELDEGGKLDDKIKESLIEVKASLKREGVNYYYTEDYDKALSDFENVLEVNEIDLFAGELDTIMVQYSGIIAREIAGKTEDEALYHKAISYYQQLADAGFGGPNTYLQMKLDYLSLKDTVKALEIMLQAYNKYPDTVNIISNCADTYIQMKQEDKVKAVLEKAVEGDDKSFEAAYRLGVLEYEAGEYNKSSVNLYDASVLQPNHFEVKYKLSQSLLKAGAFNKAASSSASAEKLQPENTDILVLQAEIFNKQGKNGKAIDYLKQAMVKDKNSADLHNRLGAIYVENI